MFYYARNFTSFLLLCTDYRLGIYLLVWNLLSYLLLPWPRSDFKGKIEHLSPSSLDRQALNEISKETWLVMFSAPWSKSSLNAQHTFTDLSAEYGSDKFRFGELEISRWPKLATKFHINIESVPCQLPTFMLFKHGKLVKRLPEKEQNWERWSRLRTLLIGYFELDMLAAKEL